MNTGQILLANVSKGHLGTDLFHTLRVFLVTVIAFMRFHR